MNAALLRRIALDNMFLALQYGASGLVPLLLIPYVIGHIGLAEYGTLAISLSWAGYGALVVNYAFPLSGPSQLAQLVPGESVGDLVSRVFSAKGTLLAGVSLATIVALGISFALGHRITAATLMIAFALPLAAALNMSWYLQAIDRFAAVSAVSVLGSFLSLIVGFGGVKKDDPTSVFAAAVAFSAAPLVVGMGTLLICMRHVIRKGLAIRFSNPFGELRQGFPLLFSQLVSALYTASGPIMIGYLAGLREAGAYGAVERIANALASVFLLTHTAAYPSLTRLFNVDRVSYFRLLAFVIGVYVLLTSLVAFGVLMLKNGALGLLFGDNCADYQLLLVGGVVWMLLGIFGPALTGYLTVSGRAREILPLTARVLVLSLLLGIPSTLVFGAWAWLASLCTAQVFVLYGCWRAWHERTL